MFRSMGATRRSVAVKSPFIAVALVTIAYGIAGLITSSPPSWTLVIAVVLSVIICGPLQVHVGRHPGYPFVGVYIAMLAILPVEESPQLSVGIWAIGLLVSQLLQRRHVFFALYTTGLGSAAAFAFLAIETSLTALGTWSFFSFLAATAAYYVLQLFGELARLWTRSPGDRNFRFDSLSPLRVGYVVVMVAIVSTLMQALNTTVIPWLESDPHADLTPFVVLLTALVFYAFAQHMRHSGIERRLRAVVEAAIQLPRETGAGLACALQSRAKSIVQANEVELRSEAPEHNEIGSAVSLEVGVDQYLIASRKVGGVPFAREDERALATLTHMASEAARIRAEVDTLERRANSDPLTGLPNYGSFQRELVEANENRSYHEGIAVLFLDLDNFKNLNDTLGHSAGDELLRTVATRLQDSAGGGDFVSRVGGDEFIVILRGLDSPEQAKVSADRVIEAVSRPLSLEGHDMRPIVSAGLAYSGHRELDAQTLVEDADHTMLKAKRSRRQGITLEDSSVSLSSHRSTRTNDIVARAIRDNRLGLAFQPIVSIERNEIWAFEALVRYTDPEIGPISPPSLVARAKSLGLMNELTKQVVTKALGAAEEFHQIESSISHIAVNFEMGQISETELGPFIRAVARAHPDLSLCIELNERSLRAATDEIRREAEQLQQAGVTIALDDYGSDDSSVGALVHFPMDILKIDKSLISTLADVRQREIIKSLQGFGDNLGYTTVVEGIETPAMLDVLAELGVRSAQGYYFGRPLSSELTVNRLRDFGTQAIID